MDENIQQENTKSLWAETCLHKIKLNWPSDNF